MAWKGLHITQASRLTLRNGQCCIKQAEGEVLAAIEDIAFIVIDTPQATISSALVAALMEAGVAMTFTDSKHTPSGLLAPFHRHHRQGAIARIQVATSKSLKRRLWQRIVKQKILNQAAVLRCNNHQDAETLKEMTRHVNPDDPGNVEARAARFYWGRLFSDFVRDAEYDRRNMLLNYGYAVVRAGVARSLVAAGLLPALGIKHDSSTNSFNLADDLFEPFRPFVDQLALRVFEENSEPEALTLDDRRAMAASLELGCKIQNEEMSLMVGTEMAAANLVRCFESKTATLLTLPVLNKPL